MKNLLLIHGALGSGKQFEELKKLLDGKYAVHIYEFPGHGNRISEKTDYTIEFFANDLHKYLTSNFNEPVKIFGYSMGGYVSLYLDSLHNGLIEEVITLGTKFAWSPEAASNEVKKLNPDFLLEKASQYCDYLKSLHGEHWKTVLKGTENIMLRLGENPLINPDACAKISCKVSLNLGGLDKMVTLDETQLIHELIDGSSLNVIEGFVHPLERLDVARLSTIL